MFIGHSLYVVARQPISIILRVLLGLILAASERHTKLLKVITFQL